MSEAGFSASDLDKLQAMPWKDYIVAANKASQKLNQELGTGGGQRRGFNPVVDGTILPQDPYYPEPAPTASAVPMIICSMVDEQSPSWMDSKLENATDFNRGRGST